VEEFQILSKLEFSKYNTVAQFVYHVEASCIFLHSRAFSWLARDPLYVAIGNEFTRYLQALMALNACIQSVRWGIIRERAEPSRDSRNNDYSSMTNITHQDLRSGARPRQHCCRWHFLATRVNTRQGETTMLLFFFCSILSLTRPERLERSSRTGFTREIRRDCESRDQPITPLSSPTSQNGKRASATRF